MSIEVLKAIRTRLQTDPVLSDFWQAHYQKDAQHYIGYQRAPSANDYPSICYVPVSSALEGDLHNEHRISLVVAVHEPGLTDNVFDGMQRLSDACDIIVGILDVYEAETGYSWIEGAVNVMSDLGVRHPFYEVEIQFTLKA